MLEPRAEIMMSSLLTASKIIPHITHEEYLFSQCSALQFTALQYITMSRALPYDL